MVKVAYTELGGGQYYRPLPVDGSYRETVKPFRVIDDIPEDPPPQDGPESDRTDYIPSCGRRYLMSYTIQQLSDGSWRWRAYDESGSEGIMMMTGTASSPATAIERAKDYVESTCPLPPPQDDDDDDDEDDGGGSNGDVNGGGNGGDQLVEIESQKYEFVFIGIIAFAVLAQVFLGGE
jgi:hypothetical protein